MPGPTDEARVDYVLSEIVPGFQLIPTWVGLWVPKGTPDAIIKRLQSHQYHQQRSFLHQDIDRRRR